MAKEATIRKHARAKLSAEGWHTWCPPKVRFYETDIFGVWDCLALKEGEFPRFIQWTSKNNLSARVKKVNNFLKSSGVEVWSEVWGWDEKKREFEIRKQ